jgi:hypothetical protein
VSLSDIVKKQRQTPDQLGLTFNLSLLTFKEINGVDKPLKIMIDFYNHFEKEDDFSK